MEPASSAPDPQALTSLHVRQARQGDAASLEWLVRKFSPLLRANAAYRLGKRLSSIYDPEDIVQQVWLVALPRLPELPPREGRFTPVLMRFLSTTLLHHVNNLIKKHLRGKPRRVEPAMDEDGQPASWSGEVAARTTAMLARLVRRELRDEVDAALGRLEERDREILLLRGVEGEAYKDIAGLLGDDPKILAVRYQRALEKLRRELPGSVFEEFDASAD